MDNELSGCDNVVSSLYGLALGSGASPWSSAQVIPSLEDGDYATVATLVRDVVKTALDPRVVLLTEPVRVSVRVGVSVRVTALDPRVVPLTEPVSVIELVLVCVCVRVCVLCVRVFMCVCGSWCWVR